MTYGSGTGGPTMTVADTANPATPAATATTDPNSARTDAVVVDAPVSFTYDAALSSSPTTSFVDGVAGRDYGVSDRLLPRARQLQADRLRGQGRVRLICFHSDGLPQQLQPCRIGERAESRRNFVVLRRLPSMPPQPGPTLRA